MRLQPPVRAEIGRAEAELVTLRDLLGLLDSSVDSSAVSAPKRKYTHSKKSKVGKKRGRPTNAEIAAREAAQKSAGGGLSLVV